MAKPKTKQVVEPKAEFSAELTAAEPKAQTLQEYVDSLPADKKDYILSLLPKDVFVVGIDPGNILTKISYLTADGNIQSFSIPTVIAPVTDTRTKIKGSVGRGRQKDKDLHNLVLRIDTKSGFRGASGDEMKHVIVGETAKNKEFTETNQQPQAEADKHNSDIHRVMIFSGLATAAWRAGKTGTVRVALSTGLPIEEIKDSKHHQLLDSLKGTHTVTATDGEYQGQTITLEILVDSTDAVTSSVNAEGISSVNALAFNIMQGYLIDTGVLDELGDTFGVADLGAGTLDASVYVENELDPYLTKNDFIGTNSHIDAIIQDVLAHDKFKKMAEEFPETRPYQTREEFMKEVVIPAVVKAVETNSAPAFTAEWGVSVDVTDIVNTHRQNYVAEALRYIRKQALTAKVKKEALVGGGVLFGYEFFLQHQPVLKEESNIELIFPQPLLEAAHFTSRAYVIEKALSLLPDEDEA